MLVIFRHYSGLEFILIQNRFNGKCIRWKKDGEEKVKEKASSILITCSLVLENKQYKTKIRSH
jgi:hypothetical protein